jgi:hypothetical protein
MLGPALGCIGWLGFAGHNACLMDFARCDLLGPAPVWLIGPTWFCRARRLAGSRWLGFAGHGAWLPGCGLAVPGPACCCSGRLSFPKPGASTFLAGVCWARFVLGYRSGRFFAKPGTWLVCAGIALPARSLPVCAEPCPLPHTMLLWLARLCRTRRLSGFFLLAKLCSRTGAIVRASMALPG